MSLHPLDDEDKPAAEEDNISGQGKEQGQDERNYIRQAGWKALFGFTSKKHLGVLSGAIFFAVIAGLILPGQSLLFGLVFNQFANYRSGRISGPALLINVSKYSVYMTALGAGCWFSNALYFMFWLSFGELQARSARDRVFRNLISKDIIWYDMRKNGVGAFLPRVQMQIRELQLSTSQPMGEVFQCLVTGLGSLVLALYFTWDLTLVIICTVPIVYLFMAFLSTRMEPNVHGQGEKLQEALKYVTNAFQSIEMVKSFNGQNSELWRYSRAIKGAATYYIRQANLQSLQMGFMQFATLGMFVQGFWYGSSLVNSGKKNPGQVMTTFWAALMAVQSIIGFLPQLIVLEKGRIAGAKLSAVIAEMQEEGNYPGFVKGVRPQHCAGDIEIKNASFAYPTHPSKLALCDATIFFPAGETTFVVGKSGSGKSTLGQLLLRFYEPSEGEIRLDRHPLQTLDIRWLRENITLVEQHSVLFDDTIFQNIAMVKQESRNVTVDEVKEASQFALLQHVVNDMPDGFNTMVGSKGNAISGGQRQRVALARARLRDTPILILDESTSALDYITRSLVLDAIRVWRSGKTTIIITHDISQILPQDYVYVLERSQVAQEGYRKSIEANIGSPFDAFLSSQVDGVSEVDEPEDDSSNHLLSLYADSTNSVNSQDATSQYSSNPIDPLDAYLEQRESDLPYRRTVFSIPPGTPSQRNSIVPHVASPYWAFMPGAAENVATLAGSFQPYSSRPPPTYKSTISPYQKHRIDNSTETNIQSMPRYGETATRNYSSPTSMRRPRKLSPIRLLDQPVKLETKLRSWKRERKQKLEAEPTLSMTTILFKVWPKLDWISRLLLVAALFAACIHASATPVFSFVFSRLLSTFYIPTNQHSMALAYSLAILAIAAIDGISSYLFHFLLEYCAQVWINNTKMEAMRQLLDQPREFFDKEQNGVSRLAECLDHFAEETRNILGRFTGVIFVVIVMITIALVWSLISCWKLTLVAIAIAPIMYAITTSYKAISGKWEGHTNDADEKVGAILHETFINIRTVRSLTLEETFHKKYINATTNAFKVGLKRAFYSGIFFGLTDSAILFVTAFLFWYGAIVVSSGDFDTTHIIQTFSVLLLSTSYANSIIALIPQIGTAKDAATRFLRLSSLPQTSHEHSGTVRIPSVGNIALHNLSFTYPTRPDQIVLREVNINIPAGRCIAIVGTSGSGKSTIASLLLKLYTTDGGNTRPSSTPEITLSGRNIKRIHTPTLRSLISIVSQTPTLFPGTIAENIAYGLHSSSPYASLSSVRSAATSAGIEGFIESLPGGYETIIGEGGMGISGGQAQRIAIARALVRKPNVLVLDEATSALDVTSAAIIRDSIRRLVATGQERTEAMSSSTFSGSGSGSGRGQRGMTVIIITHAREMMEIAEHIFMLEQGRVIEEGGFEELRQKRGEFARLLRGGECENGGVDDDRIQMGHGWKGKGKDNGD
ncbi:P-loop containing nucleoside triphosphate hydrolase protein [Glonium stellatum]|uniref:P-loop containing nucleoside triphosphate hydrolase protein n=1 Tax=Glonium stellatum TaxID=574774 RepID=A0A8E2EV58_9PEZI|nr:P-loop containing nucleoside triphosphate hydrolase protein [Glonium stellatum]